MAANRRPNVLMIVMDAVRAENLSLLGYGLPTTPNLERFASQLAWYSNYIAAATWTLPSSASLFTGTHVSTHGLVMDGDRISTKYDVLPEMLRNAGYATLKSTGIVPYVSEFSGLDRGFAESFEAPPPPLKRWVRSWRRRLAGSRGVERKEGVDLGLDLQTEARMAEQAKLKNRLRFWSSGFFDRGAGACFENVRQFWEANADRPRFVYMHLQETHAEYAPPHRYRGRFVPEALRSRSYAAINQRPNPHAVGLVKMTQEEYDILRGLYDGCIAYLDHRIGEMLDFLSARPDFDETLVLVTSDHGDCIGRHGVLGHQFVCYDELIRIPLVVKWPASVGLTGQQSRLGQNVDLLPTICELAGLEVPAQNEGVSLLSGSRETAWAELIKPFGLSAIKQKLHEMAPQYHRTVLAARSATHKRIVYSNDQPEELFNLVTDPGESRNLLSESELAPQDREAAETLAAAIERRRERWSKASRAVNDRLFGGDGVELEPEIEERLRALGYLD